MYSWTIYVYTVICTILKVCTCIVQRNSDIYVLITNSLYYYLFMCLFVCVFLKTIHCLIVKVLPDARPYIEKTTSYMQSVFVYVSNITTPRVFCTRIVTRNIIHLWNYYTLSTFCSMYVDSIKSSVACLNTYCF